MAAAMPQTLDSFARIPGVGSAKLEQYGSRFVEAVRGYAEPRGLPDRTDEVASHPKASSNSGREARRQERESRPGSTYEQTKALLAEGLTISRIAEQKKLGGAYHNRPYRTDDVGAGNCLHLDHLLPDTGRLRQIKAAFDLCGYDFLKPAWEHLGSEFTYDELRLARIFFQQEALSTESE